MMEGITFIVLLLLTSFLPKLSSEPICDITVLSGDRRVLNEWQSKMIDSCPENYTNRDIIRKCEHFDSSGDVDPDLFIPKTNGITNLTYINKYCGYCNNDNNTNWRRNYWRSWDQFRLLENPCNNYKSEIRALEVHKLDKWTQTFISNEVMLVTVSDRNQLECFGKEHWPMKLISNVIPCFVDNYIYGQSERMISCQYYEENGRVCDRMIFIIDVSDEYRSKYPHPHISEFNVTGGDYIVLTENEDIWYGCTQFYVTSSWGELIPISISIAFLLFYLILNFNQEYLNIDSDSSNLLLYAYSIGLVIMNVLRAYMYLKFPVLSHYFNFVNIFWTYHLFWVPLIFSEVCICMEGLLMRHKLIFRWISLATFAWFIVTVTIGFHNLSIPLVLLAFSICNFEISVEDRWENICKFISNTDNIPSCITPKWIKNASYLLSMFVFGIVLPVYLFVPEYLNFLQANENQCPSVPKHTAMLVVPFSNFPYLILDIDWILCVPLSCSIFLGWSKNCNFHKCIVNICLIMAIHAVQYYFGIHHWGTTNEHTMKHLSIDFHGVLVFFVFSTQNTMRRTPGNAAQQDNNGRFEMF